MIVSGALMRPHHDTQRLPPHEPCVKVKSNFQPRLDLLLNHSSAHVEREMVEIPLDLLL